MGTTSSSLVNDTGHVGIRTTTGVSLADRALLFFRQSASTYAQTYTHTGTRTHTHTQAHIYTYKLFLSAFFSVSLSLRN